MIYHFDKHSGNLLFSLKIPLSVKKRPHNCGLRWQSFSSFCSSGSYDFSSSRRTHSGTKTMNFRSLSIFWLKCHFHIQYTSFKLWKISLQLYKKHSFKSSKSNIFIFIFPNIIHKNVNKLWITIERTVKIFQMIPVIKKNYVYNIFLNYPHI